MGLNPLLLDVLACPKCKGDVRWQEDDQLIVCPSCGIGYPVRDGIPVMLIDEAVTIRPRSGTDAV